MAHGMFHWNELMTRDVAAAKGFYAKIMGWAVQEMPMPQGFTYYVFMAGDKPAGGMMEMKGPEFEQMVPHWFSYIEVDDVDKRVAEAKEAGAAVMREPFDVEMAGRIAIVKDPSDAVIGWITPAAQN